MKQRRKKTQQIAQTLGGRTVSLKTDLCRDEDVKRAASEAAGLGTIRFVANVAGIQHIDAIENFPMEKYDLMKKLMLRAPSTFPGWPHPMRSEAPTEPA